MVSSYFKILRNKNFLFLWLGQIISQFGDRLNQMALIGLIYKLQPGSSFGLAKIFSLAIIPVFLISPVAGVYTDRWNKRKTMFYSDISRCLLILLIPLSIQWFKTIIPIYFFVFFAFCVGRFFIPAKMAIIPSLVEKDEILMGNSLVSITAMIAAMLGLGVGGIIVEKWGVKVTFIIDAATFFLSSFLIFFMRVKEKVEFAPRDIIKLGKDAILKVRSSVIFDVQEGIKYLFKSEDSRYVIKIKMVLFATMGALYTIFIVFIQNTFSTAALHLGGLAIGAGGGLFLGSLLYGRFGSNFPIKKTINFALLFSGLWLAVFAYLLRLYPSMILAFVSCVLLGILVSPIEIALNTLIHQKSENHFLGRIFSSLEIILHLAFIVFMFIASYLAEKMTPFTIIVSVCIMMALFALVNLLTKK
jgi:MFS family permease